MKGGKSEKQEEGAGKEEAKERKGTAEFERK